jgi:hypothetical protein
MLSFFFSVFFKRFSFFGSFFPFNFFIAFLSLALFIFFSSVKYKPLYFSEKKERKEKRDHRVV